MKALVYVLDSLLQVVLANLSNHINDVVRKSFAQCIKSKCIWPLHTAIQKQQFTINCEWIFKVKKKLFLFYLSLGWIFEEYRNCVALIDIFSIHSVFFTLDGKGKKNFKSKWILHNIRCSYTLHIQWYRWLISSIVAWKSTIAIWF